MQRLTLCLFAGTLLTTLSGCSNLQENSSDSNLFDKVPAHTPGSYRGKEIPSQFFTAYKKVDNGHDFRGYYFGKRHWSFGD